VVIDTWQVRIDVPKDMQRIQRALNMHYLKKEACNRQEGDRIVVDYDRDSKEGRALEEAHRSANRHSQAHLTVFLHHTGQVTLTPDLKGN